MVRRPWRSWEHSSAILNGLCLETMPPAANPQSYHCIHYPVAFLCMLRHLLHGRISGYPQCRSQADLSSGRPCSFLVAGLLTLLAIVGASLWLVERTQDYVSEVVAAREIRSAIADLRTLVEAETGQRGFLLAAEEPYNRDDADLPLFQRSPVSPL